MFYLLQHVFAQFLLPLPLNHPFLEQQPVEIPPHCLNYRNQFLVFVAIMTITWKINFLSLNNTFYS